MSTDFELVQQLYDGFNARDLEAVLAELSEDVVWANGMDGGYVHGREGSGHIGRSNGPPLIRVWSPSRFLRQRMAPLP